MQHYRKGPFKGFKNGITIRNGLVFYKPLHHSHRELQYCRHDYIKEFVATEFFISITENGDPSENGIAERVNGILKAEFLLNKQLAATTRH